MGDLNDFEFSGTLDILESAPLANLMETLPKRERYSYVFDGNSQTLDQILVTRALRSGAEYDSVHVNAEFYDQASDHDPQVARLRP
jgi:predicted extracellular nuclease